MAQVDDFLAEVLPRWQRAYRALCGGDVEPSAQADEQWLLDLERKFFTELVNHPKSQERMMGMMQTGKPVRN